MSPHNKIVKFVLKGREIVYTSIPEGVTLVVDDEDTRTTLQVQANGFKTRYDWFDKDGKPTKHHPDVKRRL
ncbi:MAG: hypothetical protein XU15_C0011G0048 [candidate division NC10 bacterium CSP1-5]|nr:MAG: hypothetical protein XU15_C0011G0048 [candidate division NC10 bacterium CSP1-5]